MSFVMHKHGINMHVLPSFIQIFYTWLLMQNSLFIHFKLIIVNYGKKSTKTTSVQLVFVIFADTILRL